MKNLNRSHSYFYSNQYNSFIGTELDNPIILSFLESKTNTPLEIIEESFITTETDSFLIILKYPELKPNPIKCLTPRENLSGKELNFIDSIPSGLSYENIPQLKKLIDSKLIEITPTPMELIVSYINNNETYPPIPSDLPLNYLPTFYKIKEFQDYIKADFSIDTLREMIIDYDKLSLQTIELKTIK